MHALLKQTDKVKYYFNIFYKYILINIRINCLVNIPMGK